MAGICALALGLSACGEEAGSCDDVHCDFGVCESGSCTNPSQCRVDDDCVAGYECSAAYTCIATTECASDDECDAGVCQGGACVNPDSCATNADCVARTFCGPSGTCEPDPCNDVSCARGVCDRGTDNCVSADSCTPETAAFDCILSERCAEGTCAPAETFCEAITCDDGGVCSFAAGGCANADDCAGDDANCVSGYFCNDQNQCQQSLCLGVSCTTGICEPSTGQCQNATSCVTSNDCLDDHLCIEGACRLEAAACGDAGGDGGCPGNQVCNYDASALTATCAEPDTCTTSLDCTGERQCAGRECIDPVACVPDALEPNNATGEATVFTDVAFHNTLSASLCDGDTDVYAFATQNLENTLLRGTMVVELDAAPRDIGLGQLIVTLYKDGAEIDSASTGAMGAEGAARIELPVDAGSVGNYMIEVAGDAVATAGVSYDLSINLLDDAAVSACADATPILVDQRLSGTTDDSVSTRFGSSCTSVDNASAEVVYSLEVDHAMEVAFTLNPLVSMADLSMSLRADCEEAATEMSCADGVGAGTEETLTALLDRGTYYLVVQAADGASGGDFQLLLESINTFCSPQQDYCSDPNTSNYCVGGGGRFISQTCAEGCNPSTGRCYPPAGDQCLDAPTITDGTRVDVNLTQIRDDYSVSATDCGVAPPSQTDGPDRVFEVEVPAGETMFAQTIFANEVDGSMYLLDSCGVASSCTGVSSFDATAGAQKLYYVNDTSSPKTLFLVVDAAANQPFDTAQLDVWFLPTACSSGETRCNPNDPRAIQICSEDQTEFLDHESCGIWQCDTGECRIPDTCAGALDITAEASQPGGVNYSGPWGGYGSDLSGSGCGLGTYDVNDNELVFQISLQAGEVVHAVHDISSFSYPSLWVQPTCADLDSVSCLAGSGGSSSAAELYYRATRAETVYLVADSDYASSSITFDLTVEIIQGCDPATTTTACSGGNVEYCTPQGALLTYQCSGGGCTNAMCDTRTADWCYDTDNITADAQTAAGATRTVDFGALSNDFAVDGVCGLYDYETDGTDAYYAVDLLAGQVLTASLDPGTSIDDPALAVVTDCLTASSCATGDDQSSTPATVTYLASVDETVYLVADNDNDTGTGAFTLNASLYQSECDPATYVGSCNDTTTLETCATDYRLTQKSCPGSCDGATGSCINAPDTFASARDITADASQAGGVVISDIWDPYANDIEGSGCSLTSGDTDGHDAVFVVQLQAGQTITATQTNPHDPSTWYADPALYLLNTTSLSSTSCMAGDEGADAAATTAFTAQTTGTYYLVADSDDLNSSSRPETWQLTVEIN